MTIRSTTMFEGRVITLEEFRAIQRERAASTPPRDREADEANETIAASWNPPVRYNGD